MNTAKVLVTLAILAAVGAGFYLFSSNKNISPQSPSEVVSSFYTSYQDCLKNPPQEASGQVSVYCQSHTGVTTPDFSKNIDAGGIASLGADPIGCAQNPPQNFLASDATIMADGQTATVIVKEFFGGPRLDIRVYLKKIGDQWSVDNVACPRPDPASESEATVKIKMGEKVSALGISITPQRILEDSRCPQDVQCIQAGTVRLETMLESGMGTAPQVFMLNKTITTETEAVTLIEVTPLRAEGETIKPSEYQFVFQIIKRS